MKYIKKNEVPVSLSNWLKKYEKSLLERYNNTNKKIEHIWSELGNSLDESELSETEIEQAKLETQTIIADLSASLLEEQGYICCYCGKQIDRDNFIREHFLDKNKHRNLVFSYANLLASCEGGKVTSYTIGQKVAGAEIKQIEDVLAILQKSIEDLSLEDIINHPKNKKQAFTKGDKIYFPNPPHCDTAKGNLPTIIINPAKEKDCEYSFVYSNKDDSQNVIVLAKKSVNNKLIEDTIKTLNLNADTLQRNSARILAYKKGQEEKENIWKEVFESQSQIDEYFLKQYIEDNIYTKTDGKHTPFCFVTASLLKNSFLP